jgi:hypothetical protein
MASKQKTMTIKPLRPWPAKTGQTAKKATPSTRPTTPEYVVPNSGRIAGRFEEVDKLRSKLGLSTG